MSTTADTREYLSIKLQRLDTRKSDMKVRVPPLMS